MNAPHPHAVGAVAGIVPAAGRSARMGTPKPLLEVDGEPFVGRAVRVLRAGGCMDVIVVVAAGAAAIRSAAEAAGGRVVENPGTASEQVDSVRLALAELPDAAAAAVLPVDVPYVAAATVEAVLDGWRRSGAPIVVPMHDGVAGHPILLARSVFAEVLQAMLPEGIRSLLDARADRVVTVPVDDAGALVDLDTPADLRRHGGAT
jgi:CTP:molybdopterin cytidylyltransferase MocA